MPNNQFINLEELSKTTQALLSKINEQSNLKVNKNNVKAELETGIKIGSIEGIEFYTPEVDTSNFLTYDNLNLAQVAFSGSYNDLNNKPTLATVATTGSYNDLKNQPSLATVATSGLYVDIQNSPNIPIVDIDSSKRQIVSSLFYPTSDYPTFLLHNISPISFNYSITISFQHSVKNLNISIYDSAGKPISSGTIPNGYHYVTDYTVTTGTNNSAIMYLNTQAYNSITVSGHTVATNVPVNAKFTDTIYDDTAISSRITTLENAGYQNSTQVNSAIATAIGGINQFEVAIVTDLPTTDIDTHTIYFKSNSSSGNNVYDEYMYISSNWELIGSTAVDLSGYLQNSDIADWAKQTNKPTYTAAEVGALPNDTIIPTVPTNVSAFTNDAGYLTSYTETDPTVPAWAKASAKPTYTAAEVGALSAQNSALTASLGTDVLRIGKSSYSEGWAGQLQLSNNHDLNGYTTITPTATSDISINLPSTAGTLALTSQIPAAQVQSDWNATSGMGVILNKPTIPVATTVTQTLTSGTKIGEVNGVSLYAPEAGNEGISTETDPIFSASPAAGITTENITAWNAKSDFSGSYNDLSDKPTIPTVPTNVSAFTNDSGYLTSYTETDPTVPAWAKASAKPTYTASEVGAAASGHVHGNVKNDGTITVNTSMANGDRLLFSDASDSSKIKNTSITIGTSTTQYLANNGTWQNLPTVSVSQTLTSGTEIGSVNSTKLYAPVPYDDSALAARVTALEQLEWATYYSGRSNPSNSQGQNGDIYLQY